MLSSALKTPDTKFQQEKIKLIPFRLINNNVCRTNQLYNLLNIQNSKTIRINNVSLLEVNDSLFQKCIQMNVF